MENIVPSKKTNDVSYLTKSPDMPLQYDKPDNDNEVDNIVPSEKTNDVNDLTK